MTETIRTDNSETLKNALLRIKAIEEQIEYAKAIIKEGQKIVLYREDADKAYSLLRSKIGEIMNKED